MTGPVTGPVTGSPAALAQVRSVADAVLYEGYLLYPYRASSSKNRSRWQFGVLGPPRASADSFAEQPTMSMQCLLELDDRSPRTERDAATVTVRLRFLQLQERVVERLAGREHVPVERLVVDGHTVLSWQEASEHEVTLPAYNVEEAVDTLGSPSAAVVGVGVPAGVTTEPVVDAAGAPVGRIVRRRWPLTAVVTTTAEPDGRWVRLSVEVANACPDEARGKDSALRSSLVGAHLVVEAEGARFVSLLEPPPGAAAAAGRCRQQRCFPVLAGPAGGGTVVLGSPIILYDYPEVAAESPGALFDSTEIDEILTLRVMTMTETEKAEARATDPRAAEIIDRCDAMPASDLEQLHGVLRDPQAPSDPPSDSPSANGDVPWWDPAADESVRPEADHVLVSGIRVARGSLVRVHPLRRADAQDLFFAGQVARVTAVLSDVDGGTHVAVVLADDPAADLHDWYGRYLYFAPEELEPLSREEIRS